MSQDKRKRVTRTLIILGIVLGFSLAFFATLVVALGVSQPLMLVASDSMAPTISVGDVVAIRSAGPSGVHLGDVILYQKSLTQFRILHRVVCIVTSNSSSCTPPYYPYLNCSVPPCYYTKGDNNLAPDQLVVLSSEVHGVWTGFRIPYIGMAIICLEQNPVCGGPWGVISVLALGSAVASDIGVEYWVSRRTAKRQTLANEQLDQLAGRA